MITETGKTEVEKTEFEDGIRKARNRNQFEELFQALKSGRQLKYQIVSVVKCKGDLQIQNLIYSRQMKITSMCTNQMDEINLKLMTKQSLFLFSFRSEP